MEYLKQVDEYITKKLQWSEVLQLLREVIASTELQESVKWGYPVYTLDGKNVVGLSAFKGYAGIWFFQGAQLNDRLKVLINAQEGKTKALRQWRFKSLDEVSAKVVKVYVEEAIANQKSGNVIKASAPRKKPLVIPLEILEAFQHDKHLQARFEEFNLTRKRELTEYITEAKRPETKVRRLQKVVELIRENRGLYDKYK
ncbi:MAG: YdeI/OmpD-associated family protein [Cyclobacteriaceae bacterium]|nr:YdeI/OmpD-associated family protein [Cyclobacteriaceae bacterium]